MEQPQRSQLELYAQVTAAYQQAGFWPLFKYVYTKLGKMRRANGWFWVIMLLVLLMLSTIIAFIINYFKIFDSDLFTIFLWIMILFLIPCVIEGFCIENGIRKVFSEDINKYSGLPKAFRNNREFQRYILFRNELRKSQFESEDVKCVKPLFHVEQYTLGSYVAQTPLTAWLAATLTVIVGNSAKNWPLWLVGMVFGIGALTIFILYRVPAFITAYRRRYELRRWLTWYEADDSGTIVDPAPGSTKSLSD